MKIDGVADRCQEILGALAQVIVGKTDVLEQILAGVLANGHILIEDFPGLAKTLIARLIAGTLDLSFKRIQFTPDLLPSDITGSFLFDQRQARFEFRPGPIFTHLLLADEINRATPKTQSALLEAMQEGQVTVEGERFPLEAPFLGIATQNPIELEGTYPLPEAQLDRFLLRVAVGYPNAEEEVEILARRQRRRDDTFTIAPVTSRAELLAMQAALENVHVADVTARYVVELVRATRADHRVALGASPRGTIALLKLSRALAALRRRDFVLPDDVKAMTVPALAHRLVLKPELWASRVSAAQVVQSLLAQVPAPGAAGP
jgi:MoxR-like ATPase